MVFRFGCAGEALASWGKLSGLLPRELGTELASALAAELDAELDIERDAELDTERDAERDPERGKTTTQCQLLNQTLQKGNANREWTEGGYWRLSKCLPIGAEVDIVSACAAKLDGW